jgi:hypothetical protein
MIVPETEAVAQVLGTPTREDIHAMNPNYTEFKFPHIKAHPWSKVFSKRLPADAVDLVRVRTSRRAPALEQKERIPGLIVGSMA